MPINTYRKTIKKGKFRKALNSIKRKISLRRKSKNQKGYNLKNKKNSKLRRTLNKIKGKFRSSIKKKQKQHNLTPYEIKLINEGRYSKINNNSRVITYLETRHSKPSNNLMNDVSEYKSKGQQILNRNLGKTKRTRLNRTKRFIKSLSPRRVINRLKRRKKRKKI